MNAMSCYICGADGEVGVRALCREHQQRLPLLEAENARLQARVMELGRGVAELLVERDGYKALAERRGEWDPILKAAQKQDIKWKKPMPDIDFGDEAVYVWALKAQEEMGELSAALLGGLIGKEGRGDVLEECYQLIAVLLRITRAALAATPELTTR